MPRKRRLTKEQKLEINIIEALMETGGIMSAASEWLKNNKGIVMSSRELATKVNASKTLRDAAEEAENDTLDRAETNIRDAIIEGNMAATTFYLKTKGKKRGYGTQPGEKEVPERSPQVVVMEFPDNGRDRQR